MKFQSWTGSETVNRGIEKCLEDKGLQYSKSGGFDGKPVTYRIPAFHMVRSIMALTKVFSVMFPMGSDTTAYVDDKNFRQR